MSGSDPEGVTIKCNCGHVIREHYHLYDPNNGPHAEPCPACGEVVDLFMVAHSLWLDSLTAKQGPPTLVMTGICPGCGAKPRHEYWTDFKGSLAEVQAIAHCDECDLDFPLTPDRG